MKNIEKGDVVQIARAELKTDLLVTDVGDDGRAGLAAIGGWTLLDSRLEVGGLTFIRKATDAEKRSTAPNWVTW